MPKLKKNLLVSIPILIFGTISIAEEYKKKSQILLSKPDLNLTQLALTNFILQGENPKIEMEGKSTASGTVIFSGKNHDLDGSLIDGGKPAVRLNGPQNILEIENVTLEGVPSAIEENYTYILDIDTLTSSLRKNADLEFTTDTVLQNTSIGSEDGYQIVYVNNSKLTLSNNFTGYGILYIEDASYPEDEPILEMKANAKWQGLIVINQQTENKSSRIYLHGSKPGLGIENFAILAVQSAIIKNNLNLVKGNIGVNSKKGNLIIGNKAKIYGSLLADTITLGNNILVKGDIHYNYFWAGKNFVLKGSKITPLKLPIIKLPKMPSFKPGKINVIKGSNAKYYLEPGAYNNVILGNNSSLYLTGGEYKISNLILGNNSKIEYLDTSVLKIDGRVILGRFSKIVPSKESLEPSDCKFYVKGNWKYLWFKPLPYRWEDVMIIKLPWLKKFVYPYVTYGFWSRNNSKLECEIIAITSTVAIENNSKFKGRLIAQNVYIGQKVTLENKESTSEKSGFLSSWANVEVYGSLLLIGNSFYIPNEGFQAKIYYSSAILNKVINTLSSRGFVIKKWREIE